MFWRLFPTSVVEKMPVRHSIGLFRGRGGLPDSRWAGLERSSELDPRCVGVVPKNLPLLGFDSDFVRPIFVSQRFREVLCSVPPMLCCGSFFPISVCSLQ